MSFSWFRVDASAVDHPKVMELATILNEPLAFTYVARLWSWAQRYATSGRITARAVPQLERALGWHGTPESLVRAFVETGLLDRDSGDVLVHDWPEFQGALVEKSKRDAELKREQRRARGARRKSAESAPGARAAPAPTLPTGQDETDGRSLREPQADAGTDQESPRSIGGQKNWGQVGERLAIWMQAQRSLTGNFPADRTGDLNAIDAWAGAWAAKYEPDDRAYDQMCAAFNAYLADEWAVAKGCTLSLWCSENVGMHRWTEERARSRPARTAQSHPEFAREAHP